MSNKPLSDIEIARQNEMRPIRQIAEGIGLNEDDFEQYGKYKAKINLEAYERLVKNNNPSKLILVSAINPTPAGEGKTTTTIGLADALNRLGKRTTVCLREPSLGPCFGVKGGAAGGGYAQVVPMEDINLHFTGDFHAIGLANNLLAAAIDNHIHQGNALNIDPRRITFKRVVDMNDRALRKVTIGLGGIGNSLPREDGYDITVASEVMAIFCLSESLDDLKDRLGKIVIGATYKREPITAKDIGVHGAMTVLLKEAFKPNLVQTLEHTPAIVHGGPFANIAHGCNSLIATKVAMSLGDYTVTEAGFGADLGAEKFFNIKCRKAGLKPDAVVLVATIRALKMHGGAALSELKEENVEAVEKGIANLEKHIENIRHFGIDAVVAINKFTADTDKEIQVLKDFCAKTEVECVLANHWADGGAGAEELAQKVIEQINAGKNQFQFLYSADTSLTDKIKTIAQKVYGASDITLDAKVSKKILNLEKQGYAQFPVCMAKTQSSLSTDASLKGRPSGFEVPVRDVKLSAGAGFIVVYTGEVMTMPGLPADPAANHIDLDDAGNVVGLF